ncbi:MAG: hypothetical protein IJU50_07080 [Lachnospiraceae bacterium]|nr:hypothetical protein [Lachnospiraceae bacterium]
MDLRKKQENVLLRLNEQLKGRKISTSFLAEEGQLTVSLSNLVPEKEINGDIYFPPLSETLGDIQLCAMEFECSDFSGLPQEKQSDVLAAATMLNAAIPMGCFCVQGDEEDSPVGSLVFRQELVLPSAISLEKLCEEVEQTFHVAERVIKDSLPQLLEFAEGKVAQEGLLGND